LSSGEHCPACGWPMRLTDLGSHEPILKRFEWECGNRDCASFNHEE
jgi:hypothetical protein